MRRAARILGLAGLLGAALLPAAPAPALDGPGARAWAAARARDAWQGFTYWSPGWKNPVNWEAYGKLSYAQQTRMLLDLFKDGVERFADAQARAGDRRAALILLGQRPLEDWAGPALETRGRYRDDLVYLLYLKGYRCNGGDPLGYLAGYDRLDRPWTHGLGLHLEPGGGFRLQWLPSPALLPAEANAGALPAALAGAAQPGVLIHLAQLKPGLERLRALAGDGDGLAGALARSTRFAFLLQHLAFWLDRGAPGLAALGQREAWILHYGGWREGDPPPGTLCFLPGELPMAARLALDLLRLNPLSSGARVRSATWKGPAGDSAEITQIRASGGVLDLATVPGGIFLSDGDGALRAALFPGPRTTLGERQEWCRRALAGMRPDTQVSLWVTPRQAAGAGFELAADLLRERPGRPGAAGRPEPALARAAPCAGALALALGSGPTGLMAEAVLRTDLADPVADPELPAFTEGAGLTPEQSRAYQADLRRAWIRRQQARALRTELDALAGSLDFRGAALCWTGWVAPPPLSAAQNEALRAFQSLRREDPSRATALQRRGEAGPYGGFGEPGLAPGLALAVRVRPGREGAVRAGLGRMLPLMFRGRPEKRNLGGVELHRVATEQAFTPAWALVRGTLVAGSDDGAVQAVAAGLMGQAPTLADSPGQAFGSARLDGPRLAGNLETLLLAYTRGVTQGSPFWWLAGPDSGDDGTAEVAAVFGPFLGALRGLGQCTLDLDWGPAGLEARPR